jgi:hypothetical protein
MRGALSDAAVRNGENGNDGEEGEDHPAGQLRHLAPGTDAERAVELPTAAEGAGHVARSALQQHQANDEEAKRPDKNEQDIDDGVEHGRPFSGSRRK